MMIFPKPLDIWYPTLIFCYLIGEVAGYLREVVFCGGEYALARVIRVLYDDQASTGCGDDTDGASAAIQRVARAAPIEVPYNHYGAACPLGQLRQWGEDLAHLLVAGRVKTVS